MMAHLPEGVSATDAGSAGDNLSDAFRCVAEGLKKNRELRCCIVAGGGGAPSISLYAAALAARWGQSRSTTWTVTQHDWRSRKRFGANASIHDTERHRRRAMIDAQLVRRP